MEVVDVVSGIAKVGQLEDVAEDSSIGGLRSVLVHGQGLVGRVGLLRHGPIVVGEGLADIAVQLIDSASELVLGDHVAILEVPDLDCKWKSVSSVMGMRVRSGEQCLTYHGDNSIVEHVAIRARRKEGTLIRDHVL